MSNRMRKFSLLIACITSLFAINANSAVSVTKTTALTGEYYTISWTDSHVVEVWEEVDGERTRGWSGANSSLTLRQKEAGTYVYKIRRCASTCGTPMTVGIQVRQRMCSSLNDLYNYTEWGACQVQATRAYSGRGNVDVKLYPASSSNRRTDKMLFIVSGYSLGEGIDDSALMRDVQLVLKNNGYHMDIVYFDYSRYNSDYLQNKSYALEAALKRVNQLRGGAYSSVLVGTSLGGVVARHALVTLEDAGYQHGVEKYISIDSPHLGAHVPLSLQRIPLFLSDAMRQAAGDNNGGPWNEFLQFFSRDLQRGIDSAKEASDVARLLFDEQVDNPAARQLLIQHIAHANGRHSSAGDLISELRNMGLPQQSENIAVAYGSDNGTTQLRDKPYYFYYDSGSGKPNLKLRPYIAGSQAMVAGAPVGDSIFYGRLEYPSTLGYRSFTRNYGHSGSKLDTLPCSTIPLPDEMVQILKESLSGEFAVGQLNASVPDSCFIPTLSALAVDDVPITSTAKHDLHTLSPFDRIYTNPQNGSHASQFGDCTTRNVVLDAVGGVYGGPAHMWQTCSSPSTSSALSSSSSSSTSGSSCGANAGKRYGVTCPDTMPSAISFCGSCPIVASGGGVSGCVDVKCGY